MTDFDADEPVQPVKNERRAGFLTSDRFLAMSGVLLAATAAFFPWYVFFNEDKFGIDIAKSILSRDLPEWAGRAKVNPSPAAIGDNDDVSPLPRSEEEIVTATVPVDEAKPGDSAGEADLAQPFPSEPNEFHLLHASGGKAMIEDKNGIYIVTAGSMLPDLSHVASLEKRDGEWVLVTDKGDIYDASGKRTQ